MTTVGSLFSGIGGFDLGFERAGMHTEWFVEQDSYCQRVLAKHWPGVPIYDDVCAVTADDLAPVDVLCGGFPCQDISAAGKGAGLAGARSGLWAEFHRLIGELRPRYVVVENVPVLRSRGLGRILGEMAALGYDAEWDCVPACAVGAPHRRDRVWVVAYPQREQLRQQPGRGSRPDGAGEALAAVDGAQRALGDTHSVAGAPSIPVDRERGQVEQPGAFARAVGPDGSTWSPWSAEPDVGRVADGVPARVDRLRALGNALVPQIAELIGLRIMAHEGGTT